MGVNKSSFYKSLFNEGAKWSTTFPNQDEIQRMSIIFQFIARLKNKKRENGKDEFRILDIGCGRGWLTNLLKIFGTTEGVDPVDEVIEQAKRHYPEIIFYTGDVRAVMSRGFVPYDLVVATEVIEHVRNKSAFVKDIKRILRPRGYAILTTPRKRLYSKWCKAGFGRQPVEEWLAENEMRALFERCNFNEIDYDRVYVDSPRLSLVNRACASKKAAKWLKRLRCYWIIRALMYHYSLYQAWCFQRI